MVMFGKKSQEPSEADALDGGAGAQTQEGWEKKKREEKEMHTNKGTDAVKPDISNQKRNTTVGTVIGDDTTIEGKVSSKGTLRIDGTVKGEVHADDTIIVGPTGNVQASLTAKVITISGKVHGNITANERLELQPTCEILGDVKTQEGALVIESGARLEGTCSMGMSHNASAGKAPGGAPNQGKPPENKTPMAKVLDADAAAR